MPTGALAVLLIVCVSSGCATPVVTDRWLARHRVVEGGFKLGDGDLVRWRVRGGGAVREGQFALRSSDPVCASRSVLLVIPSGLHPLDREEWTWLRLRDDLSGESPEPVSAPARDVILALETFGRDHDPVFSIRRGGASLGELEVFPARRYAFLLLYPPALIADAVLAVTGVGLFALLTSDTSYTWVPGEKIEERDSRSEDEEDPIGGPRRNDEC